MLTIDEVIEKGQNIDDTELAQKFLYIMTDDKYDFKKKVKISITIE